VVLFVCFSLPAGLGMDFSPASCIQLGYVRNFKKLKLSMINSLNPTSDA
jgi:hypothetical protein